MSKQFTTSFRISVTIITLRNINTRKKSVKSDFFKKQSCISIKFSCSFNLSTQNFVKSVKNFLEKCQTHYPIPIRNINIISYKKCKIRRAEPFLCEYHNFHYTGFLSH